MTGSTRQQAVEDNQLTFFCMSGLVVGGNRRAGWWTFRSDIIALKYHRRGLGVFFIALLGRVYLSVCACIHRTV
jgi:hypothetical protein